ncbi:MAG: DUF882 domain-containing protein [Aestuariivirgaceae bacterium]
MKHLLTTVIRSFAVFFAGTMLCLSSVGQAAAEVRTISLYHVHTRESLTITYKKDGRYIPSAMAQINYLLRDWRKNRPTTMSPETIDLMWELHEDLGSKQPIRIICGFRSAETNAMLKKIGRHVARQSQHITGKAIDMYFPDVPLERVRNSALVRQIGGVGYYPASGGGFIHVDSGHVRHWPRISPTKLAQIYGEYARTVGARSRLGASSFQVAAAEPKFTAAPKSAAAAAPPPAAAEGDADENGARADALRDEDFESYTPAPKAVAKADTPPEPIIPRPRPKPIEVLMLAAANMQIEPASAPVDKPNFAERPVTMQESLGPVNADANLVGERDLTSNVAAKGSFAMELISASTKDAPMIRPLTEGSSEVTWHASLMSASRLVRRDGSPQPFGRPDPAPGQLTAARLPAVQAMHARVLSTMSGELAGDSDGPSSAGTGKGDMLEVNRDGKRDLTDPGPAPAPKARLSAIDQFLGLFSRQ